MLTDDEQWSKFYDVDLPGGQEWEGFFKSIVGTGKVENKRDKLTHNTGNVFIEYECRGKKSGLSTTSAEWWAIGIENESGDIESALLLSVPYLRDLCKKLWDERPHVRGGDNGLSRGILLKMDDFRR